MSDHERLRKDIHQIAEQAASGVYHVGQIEMAIKWLVLAEIEAALRYRAQADKMSPPYYPSQEPSAPQEKP